MGVVYEPSLEEELAKKILEAMAGFSAALDSSDSQEKRKFIAQIQTVSKSLDDYYKDKLSGFTDC